VRVRTNESLPEFAAILTVDGTALASISSRRGTPDRPLAASELTDKIANLAGHRLDGALDDLAAPAGSRSRRPA
jgi:hypothetical protein